MICNDRFPLGETITCQLELGHAGECETVFDQPSPNIPGQRETAMTFHVKWSRVSGDHVADISPSTTGP